MNLDDYIEFSKICLIEYVVLKNFSFLSDALIIKQGCHNWTFCKSRGYNFYSFLYLDCHEFSHNKLGAKNYRFSNR